VLKDPLKFPTQKVSLFVAKVPPKFPTASARISAENSA